MWKRWKNGTKSNKVADLGSGGGVRAQPPAEVGGYVLSSLSSIPSPRWVSLLTLSVLLPALPRSSSNKVTEVRPQVQSVASFQSLRKLRT